MRKNHFLLCISSLHRPQEAMCQVHRFFAANKNTNVFDISLIIRQVDEKTFYSQIKEDLQQYIDQGRLFLNLVNDDRHVPNKMNIANMALDLAECITMTNSENKYDYFCKIDDDDFYHPSYINSIFEVTKNNDVVGCCVECSTTMQTTKIERDGVVRSYDYTGDTCGGTLVFNNDAFKIFKEYAHNIKNAKTILKKYGMEELYFDKMLQGVCEDRTLYGIISVLSKMKKVPFVKLKNKFLYSLYRIYPGFMYEERR